MLQPGPCTTTIEPVLQTLGAATTEPMCCNYWSPCAAITEAHAPEDPCSATRGTHAPQPRSTPTLQLDKSPLSNEDPAQTKIK